MPKREDANDFIGRKHGRLTVVEDLGRVGGARRVMAKCDCGNIKEFRLPSLKNGMIRSCGCFLKESSAQRSTKHGLCKHPLQKVWGSIKARCYNPNDPSYKNYGARGVKMSIRWIDDFEAFYNWCIKNGWSKGMDVDKDIKSSTGSGILYCPELCSIVSRKVNLRAKRNNKYIEYNGVKRCVSEWSEVSGIKRRTLMDRIRKGWTGDKLFKINSK